MTYPEHIHTLDDGRGFNRQVFLDGVKLDLVIYADTKLGIARVYQQPPKRDKEGNLLTKTLHGTVEVRNG